VGGPAEKAGVEAGDIITKVDAKVVDSAGELPRIIGRIKPGNKVALQVFRRGSYRDLAVVVAELEPDKTVARRAPDRDNAKPPAPVGTLGLAVSDLTDAQKRELKIKNGVRVETAEGVAARAGVREGDVIVTIDNVEVVSARQFDAAVGKLDKSKPVTLLVRRGDAANFLILRPARGMG
jgi:serine protease Do